MARILFLIMTSYLFVVVLVYFAQRYLQYVPDKNNPGAPKASNVPEMQELKVKTEDNLELLAWFAPPKEKGGKVVVLYHGNAGNISERAHKARAFIDAGFGVYLCEYRGYGGNAGSPSEQGFYADARSALNWLDKNGYPAAQWVIYGESIGSGPATQMALEFQPKELIIEVGFSSAVDVAKRVYPWLPVDLLLKDRYDNISKIKDIKSALLVLHGTNDPTVHFSSGEALYEAANHPKELVVIKGGEHMNLYDYDVDVSIINWLRKDK